MGCTLTSINFSSWLAPLAAAVISVGFALPTSGQVIDLSNVGVGDVIDSTTMISSGDVINLNGGVIASNTDTLNDVTINVNSGTVGIDIDAGGSTININGGQVSLAATNLTEGFNNIGNDINIRGGEVGSFFQLRGSSRLELSGGSLEGFGVLPGASARVTGGFFNLADVNTNLEITGGTFNSFRVFGAGSVTLFGTDFALDGVPIDGLILGDIFEIEGRGALLSGTLSDGSTFSTSLTDIVPPGGLNFSPAFGEAVPGFAADTATINVSLVTSVPEPNATVGLAMVSLIVVSRRRKYRRR